MKVKETKGDWKFGSFMTKVKQFFGFSYCARCGGWYKAKELITDGSWFICLPCKLEMSITKLDGSIAIIHQKLDKIGNMVSSLCQESEQE